MNQPLNGGPIDRLVAEYAKLICDTVAEGNGSYMPATMRVGELLTDFARRCNGLQGQEKEG